MPATSNPYTLDVASTDVDMDKDIRKMLRPASWWQLILLVPGCCSEPVSPSLAGPQLAHLLSHGLSFGCLHPGRPTPLLTLAANKT